MSEKEIEQYIIAYGDDIYRFCLHLTGNEFLAEELYQDTFVQMVRSFHKMDAGGNIKSYLMGIALNIWKNRRRKMGRRDRIAPETDIDNCNEISTDKKDDPLEICMKKEKNRMLYQAVQNLPEKQRTVLFLRYAQEMTLEEIAGLLHIPKGTVASRLSKAKQTLKKQLEDYDHE